MKVFLSHKSIEKPFVKDVVAEFPSWLSTWLDEDNILVGQDLNEALQSAILSDCNFLIVFVSDQAAQSEWVRKEIDWAQQRANELSRVFVLPVLLECSLERLSELGLEGKKAIIATGCEKNDAKDVAKKLIDQISAHCAQLLPEYTSTEAEKRQQLKTYLFAAYIALLVAGAAGGSKVMTLGPVAAGVTVISFAFTFFITDCVNEIFGQKEAAKFIAPGFMALLLATGFMYLFVFIPPHHSYHNQEQYQLILTPPFRMFCAGLVAYVVGQICNIWIFDKVRKRTTFKQRGRRNVISTLVSQFIDTLIFVPGAFLWLDGRTLTDLVPIFIGQFAVKVLVALFFSYPAFLYLTKIFRKLELKPQIG